MHFPRLPEWLTYGAVVAALTLAALGRRENADAPPAPPPLSKEEGALLAPSNTFDRTLAVSPKAGMRSGTAFSVGDGGIWLTARHVVTGCARIAVMQAPGRGAAARLATGPLGRPGGPMTDVAVLMTQGGAPALPLAPPLEISAGARGFHPGFPAGGAGEATSRFLGRQTLEPSGRDRLQRAKGATPEPVLAWAEAGRTDGLSADLSGLSGAPVLNTRGEVIGVTLAQSPRRGRIYTSTPEAIRDALRQAKVAAAPGAPNDAITVENYGRAADTLRRDLRVAQVVCLER